MFYYLELDPKWHPPSDKDGVLDFESMYNIIQNKQNFSIEIQIVYDELRP